MLLRAYFDPYLGMVHHRLVNNNNDNNNNNNNNLKVLIAHLEFSMQLQLHMIKRKKTLTKTCNY